MERSVVGMKMGNQEEEEEEIQLHQHQHQHPDDLEPHPCTCTYGQTKRMKKNAACFDLRQSLAWDTAFFTEQGVLNENELSTLTSNHAHAAPAPAPAPTKTKPSRLRMPSPSLKYFAQPTKSALPMPPTTTTTSINFNSKFQISHKHCAPTQPHNTGENKSNFELPPQHIALIHKSLDSSTQDTLMSNPVPFSDEWLAALEEVGEEILTKKTGAVQNSPPDKSLPEPGPWSPVKRKNVAEIGPFDCTKYTNQPGHNLNS